MCLPLVSSGVVWSCWKKKMICPAIGPAPFILINQRGKFDFRHEEFRDYEIDNPARPPILLHRRVNSLRMHPICMRNRRVTKRDDCHLLKDGAKWVAMPGTGVINKETKSKILPVLKIVACQQ
ncbi:hypothetical protein DAPPUDRAFT_236106 [Daphnia pulex]|uniref:Uncharacterized protein n=1 Tax=Daphnia pulex TaxID=6669 RepID=E9FZZ5_DAPPU|nr:hypothetical protein DAPPUDRAFT_236106 [Daphnia pulex]|eukprot:EFX87173.1 hypothetical protein DAPPUDRAFT_236106 [Daphnia pulex]